MNSHTEDKINFNFQFQNPKVVSSARTFDQMTFKVLEPSVFISKET